MSDAPEKRARTAEPSSSDPPSLRELRACVCSSSAVKRSAVEAALRRVFPRRALRVETVAAKSGVADQPVGEPSGRRGAQHRLDDARARHAAPEQVQLWVSIENYIEEDGQGGWRDVGLVILELEPEPGLQTGLQTGRPRVHVEQRTKAVPFEARYAEEARARSQDLGGEDAATGFATTVGKLMSEADAELEHDDWHKHPRYGGVSRRDLLESAVVRAAIRALAPGEAALRDLVLREPGLLRCVADEAMLSAKRGACFVAVAPAVRAGDAVNVQSAESVESAETARALWALAGAVAARMDAGAVVPAGAAAGIDADAALEKPSSLTLLMHEAELPADLEADRAYVVLFGGAAAACGDAAVDVLFRLS